MVHLDNLDRGLQHLMMRGMALAALAIFFTLSGCAGRGTITVAPDASEIGNVVEILVATTRGNTDDALIAARARSETVRWAAFGVSVPPERRPGTVTFPRGREPNPATDFITVSARQFADEQSFLNTLNARLAQRPRGEREVTLFVHGFNSNFAEGVYRHAQMAHDFRSPGVPVHYSWPSAASVRAYGFDRESALFARDGLERVLSLLARSNAESIVLAAHSMGALVAMETVRQISIRGSDDVLDRIQSVILIAPDLDSGLFRNEIATLAPRVLPIYITVSGRDRALRVSGLLRGQSERLGSLSDTSLVADLPGVIIINVSDVQGSGDPLNHFAVATSPEMIAFISGLDRHGTAMLRDEERPGNVFDATINAVTGFTEVRLIPRGQ